MQYRRAVCLYRLERYRDAVQLIGDIEVRYRTTKYFSYVPLWKGLSLYGLKNYSLCVDSLDKFLTGPADAEFTPQALLHKALALQALSNDEGARESLGILTTDYQSSRLFPYAAVLLGSLLQRQGSFGDLLAFTQKTDPSGFPEPWKKRLSASARRGVVAVGPAEEAQPLYIQLVGAPEDVALVAYERLFAAAQQRKDLSGHAGSDPGGGGAICGAHGRALGAVDADRGGDLPPGGPGCGGAVSAPGVERANGSAGQRGRACLPFGDPADPQ